MGRSRPLNRESRDIKNLFEKTGVSSRQELVARIFLDDYLPQLAQQTPLTSSGGFARQHDP